MIRADCMVSISWKRMWREVNPTIKQPEKSINHTEELITRKGARYQRICDMRPETEQAKNHVCGTITNMMQKEVTWDSAHSNKLVPGKL